MDLDILQTLLKLSESERQKVTETILLLKNAGATVSSNGADDKSGTEVGASSTLPNSTPEKAVSKQGKSVCKQKTLDSWIVKNKAPTSSFEKHAEEIIPVSKTGESSKSIESEAVSSTLKDHLSRSSSSNFETSDKSENVTNVCEKRVMVLLNREDCLVSMRKSPHHSEISVGMNSISPIKFKSPDNKQTSLSASFNQQSPTPEKDPLMAPRSYNLRRSKGVVDEKSSNGTRNSKGGLAKLEDDKIHKTVHKSGAKQKSKLKSSPEKDTNPNSNASLEKVNFDQETDGMSMENIKNFECGTSSPVVESESEKTSEVVAINSNKIDFTIENPTSAELDASLVVKGKRKRTTSKGKESKKLCSSNTVQKGTSVQESDEHEKINEISTSIQSVSSKKDAKLSNVDATSSEESLKKTIQLATSVDANNSSQMQITINDVKSVPKSKLKKTVKSKDKTDLLLNEKTKLNLSSTNVQKKKLLNQKINSPVTKDVDFQSEDCNNILESPKDSKFQNKDCAREAEELSAKDTSTVTSANVHSKRICRKRVNENKPITVANKKILPDSEQASSDSNKDSSVKDTDDFLKEDANTIASINVKAKRKSRKRGGENKSKVAAENSLLSDSEQASKNYDTDGLTSTETSSVKPSKSSPSLSKENATETGKSLMRTKNSLKSVNVDSKRMRGKRGSENKNKGTAKNSKKSDSEKDSKNCDIGNVISVETSSKNSRSQSKEVANETDELLKKDKDSVNVKSKRVCRKRIVDNQNKMTSKNTLISDSDQASKNNDEDCVTCFEITSSDSSKNLLSNIKEISSNLASSVNDNFSPEVVAFPLNKKKCSQSSFSHDDNLSRKDSKNFDTSTHNELNIFNEMQEPPGNQSRKPNLVSPNLPQRDEHNVLHSQEISKSPNVSKNGNTLKKSVALSFGNSRKKLKVAKDKDQSNTFKSTSDSLGAEIENSGMYVKKSSSKKKIASKFKVTADSNKGPSDIQVTKSKANTSNSTSVQEQTEQLCKNLKFNNEFQGQKEITEIKNSKKVQRSHSKQKKNSLEFQVAEINLSKDDEMGEKLNCGLVGKSIIKNKLSKKIGKANKKTPIKSTNKEKSTKQTEQSSSSEKPLHSSIHHEHSSEELLEHSLEHKTSLEVQMESHSSEDASEISHNITSPVYIVDLEKLQEMIPDTSIDDRLTNISEKGKETLDVIRGTEVSMEKMADPTTIDSNNTDFKSSVEFDEEMKHNYEAFCKLKAQLEAIGISIEELFENQEMLNSLESNPPLDGVYIISKCKSDSNYSVYLHESKTELRKILNKLKIKYPDEA